MKRVIVLSFIIIGFSTLIPEVFGWDNKLTHKDMTRVAADKSLFNSQNGLRNIGFRNGLNHTMFGKSLDEMLRDGAELEDAGFPTWSSLFSPISKSRYFNHFHDPTKAWGYGELNTIPFASPESLPLWAQDPSRQAQAEMGDHSWHTIKEEYYQALISARDALRDESFTNVFTGLGYQMHLIQDAAVPEHVRNDAHPLGASGLGRLSVFFEYWAANKRTFINSLASNPIYPDLQLDISRDGLAPITELVDTRQYIKRYIPSAITAQGLSEYTNANFFSDDTIFSGEGEQPDLTYYFPYPRATSTNVQEYIDRYVDPKTRVAADGKVEYIPYISKLRDGEIVDHFLAPIYYTMESEIVSDVTVFLSSFYRDEECHKDYAALLAPRAVGYSARLLDYFFRGSFDLKKLRIMPDEAGDFGAIAFDIKNSSKFVDRPELMGKGALDLAYRYVPPGEMNAVSGLVNNVYSVEDVYDPINSSYVPMIAAFPASIPSNAKDITISLIYRGALGAEQDAIAARVSPFPSRIAYTGQPGGGYNPSYIYAIDPDGDVDACLTCSPGAWDGYTWRAAPTWSQAGRLLAFNGITQENHNDIAAIDISSDVAYPGNIVRTFTDPDCHYLAPSFAPDGTRIVAERLLLHGPLDESDVYSSLVILDLNSGAWSFLGGMDVWKSHTPPEQPKWSPKGDAVLFQNFKEIVDGHNIFNIWSISPNGGDPVCLLDESRDSRWPSWSPDGEWIVFSSKRGGGGTYDIWIMDNAGGNARRVYKCPEDCFQPSFSPDGAKIVFQAPGGRLYTVDLYGQGLSELASTQLSGTPSWSPYVFFQ